MNENMQDKKTKLQELESMLSGKASDNKVNNAEMMIYCEYMKQFYLSCSTNN